MKIKFLTAFILLLGVVTELPAQEAKPKMRKIFNGKDLNGWVVPENNIWWTVEEGTLWAKNGPERSESILWTEESYEDFVFETDFKMGDGTVDSGIFLRDENVQIQIGISGSLKRDMTGSPYIPGKGYPVEVENLEKVIDTNGWNTMRVEARGNVFTVWLNDEKVINYTADETPNQGPIGLQLHAGNTMTVAFRNIKISEL